MITETWKEYTFEDGTISIVKGYTKYGYKLAVLKHGKVKRIRDVKIKRGCRDDNNRLNEQQ